MRKRVFKIHVIDGIHIDWPYHLPPHREYLRLAAAYRPPTEIKVESLNLSIQVDELCDPR